MYHPAYVFTAIALIFYYTFLQISFNESLFTNVYVIKTNTFNSVK